MPRLSSLNLTPHATGQYAQQIDGRMYSSGTCEAQTLRKLALLVEGMQADPNVNPAEVLRREVNSILAISLVLTIEVVGEHFRDARLRQVQNGILSPLTFKQYGEILRGVFSICRPTPVGPTRACRLHWRCHQRVPSVRNNLLPRPAPH